MPTLKLGSLGGGTLVANQEQKIYQVDAPAIASGFTVSFCNRGVVEAAVALAYGPGPDTNAPGTIYLEYNAKVRPGVPFERTCLALGAGMKLFAVSDIEKVDVAVYGFEKG